MYISGVVAHGAQDPSASDGWSPAWILIAAGTFFAVWQYLRVEGVLFTASDGFYLAGAALLLFQRGFTARPFGSLTSAYFVAFGVLIFMLSISSVANGAATRMASVGAQYIYSFFFLPMILMAQDMTRWRRLALAYLAGVIAVEIVGYAVYTFYGGSYEELLRFGRGFLTGNRRFGGFVGEANYHAAVIGLTLPFLYYFTANKTLPVWLFALCFTILAAALVSTASNSGLATSVGVTLVFMVISGRLPSPRMIALGAAAILAYVLFGPPLPAVFAERVGEGLLAGDLESAGSYEGRVELIADAWRIAQDTLIIGLGADQFRVVSSHGAPVHNVYLLLWAEGGFTAFAAWLFMFAVFASGGIMALRTRRLEAAFGLSVIFGLLIMSATTPHIYARIWVTPLFLALAPSFMPRIART